MCKAVVRQRRVTNGQALRLTSLPHDLSRSVKLKLKEGEKKKKRKKTFVQEDDVNFFDVKSDFRTCETRARTVTKGRTGRSSSWYTGSARLIIIRFAVYSSSSPLVLTSR